MVTLERIGAVRMVPPIALAGWSGGTVMTSRSKNRVRRGFLSKAYERQLCIPSHVQTDCPSTVSNSSSEA